MNAQVSMKSVLDEAANSKQLFDHQHKIAHILRHFSENGLSLAVAGDEQHLNRSESTLKRYCRKFQVKFPDYVPMSMRPRKPDA